ncbi:hypothetical protein RRX38_03355 [Pseudomonas sp. DTU_2021_1001937_2_SI_NGA_ILE_001]|uniref:hypothetical protein n=1 Tax=Pseudomonas sp. DTU_2021_1001937_2_SI_NGA_ILE_001 TaxID=3077589 RepID=UPI0028FC105A|nr:hypothetical protein [Pseudomonas sp. DTU_2021_1001937_2_SI_NGA_ILE_001]WNW10225.1 hypothetical protein RRX38_03355 [Pseudomonas sp. DTU_2021_1001937_2_SI_NGA_ILE_001]
MTPEDRNTQPDTAGRALDAEGKPVDVVRRDLEDSSAKTRGIDEAITPTSVRTKEQEAEELRRKAEKIERDVADGHA